MREIDNIIQTFQEKYAKAEICSLSVKGYSMTFKNKDEAPSLEETNQLLIDVLVKYKAITNLREKPSMSFTKKKRKGVSYITRKKTASASESADEDEEEDESKGKKKKKGRGPSAFMVGDIETLPYHVETDRPKTHVAYAAGYMIVSPIHKTENGEVIGLPNKGDVNRFYSEDYIHLIGNFLDRSTKMLEEFMARVLAAGSKLKRGGAATLYFHNLARFDGFILLRHLALQLELPYTIKPLVRNSMIYQILIYIETGNPKKPEKLVLSLLSLLGAELKKENRQ